MSESAMERRSFPRPGTLISVGVMSWLVGSVVAWMKLSPNKVTAFAVFGAFLILGGIVNEAAYRYSNWRYHDR